MIVIPAIDLYDGKVVRLLKGDYERMTVYGDDPAAKAGEIAALGACWLHIVDLAAARSGRPSEFETVCRIKRESGLLCQAGGGIRTLEAADRYISRGIDRVILGTAAAEDECFVKRAVGRHGEKIAVGVDIRDGLVSVKGWTGSSGINAFDFCKRMEDLGVGTLIITDISKDGAMQGVNRKLYGYLSSELSLRIIASGGVSSIEDVKCLAAMGLYGCIVGKAFYTGAVDLKEAIEAAK